MLLRRNEAYQNFISFAAEALLQSCNGSVEAAVAKHFNQNATERSEAPPSPASALRMLVGRDLQDHQIQDLLVQSHGSVEAAFDLHLSSLSRQNGGAEPQASTRRRGRPTADQS